MLTKDILAKPLDQLWAIARHGKSNHQKNFEDIDPINVSYVKRVNEYHYEITRLDTGNEADFTRVYGSKSYGFLTTYDKLVRDANGNEVVQKRYMVVKARDFIGEAQAYKDAWVIENARKEAEALAQREAQEKREAEYQRRKAIELAKNAVADEQAKNTAEKIGKFIEQLIGRTAVEQAKINISFGGQWLDYSDPDDATKYKTSLKGDVRLTVQDFQRLMGKFMELNNN